MIFFYINLCWSEIVCIYVFICLTYLQARENGVGVLLEAIGDDAVQTCVCALAMAREFLKDDDITFSSVVTLEELQKKGNDGILRELINFKVKCYLDPKISI